VSNIIDFSEGIYYAEFEIPMIAKTIQLLTNMLPVKIAYAHCDIPCGIYDVHHMQMAAHTVIRMTQMIEETEMTDQKHAMHQIARLTKIKEEHAELLKQELRVLWADYFKDEHVKEYPNLHDLVFKTMKLASKARQDIDMDIAKDLLSHTQEIAEIFYKTKGVKSIRVKSVYPTGLDIVLHTS